MRLLALFQPDLPTGTPHFGALAEFNTPGEVYHACQKVRDAGFKLWDAHTPFPIHGIEEAMGLSSSKLPWISLVLALSGGASIMALMWWTSVSAYPLVISGKPLFSWQAYIPITFEVSVLMGAAGAVFGMLGLNKLPTLYHPLFRSQRFERCSDDKFFISIRADDPKYDATKTVEFLKSLGAANVEIVEN